MNATAKTQTRGNCQHCGREQAIVRGAMAHHGYTVEHGYFNGACRGHNFPPMQTSRDETDRLCAAILKDCVNADRCAEDLRDGTIRPTTADSGRRIVENGRWVDEQIPFRDATPQQQRLAVQVAIIRNEQRARSGRAHVEMLRGIATALLGQPLRVVEVEAGPEPIRCGEVRTGSRGPLRVVSVRGARVYWKDGRGFKGWTGSAAWRRLPLAESETAH